ncbi:MAG: HAD-IIIC family phosphatase [Gammaproteobacteria bacterium]
MGEDGPQGIVTGGAFPGNCFRQYQRFLKQLAAGGVLLAIVSKNNETDVVEAFRIRSQDLALTLADFAATKIGWDDKVDSLRALSRELSLGLDSFVLVDDSPVECAAVRGQLPEVLVIEAPTAEPWRLVESIASLGAFDSLGITEEDRNRTREYRAQVQRAQLEQSAESREDFLASLNIRGKIIAAVDAPLSRTVQLIGKTNQFNLTTRRHSSTFVETLLQEPGAIAVAMRLTDRFGDAGVIGVAMCQTQDRRCRIDTFLLSCRVIGRGVESAFLWHLANTAKENGARWLIGEYIPTAKNHLCAEFYPKHGFRPISTAAGSHCLYEFDLSVGLPEKPWWITLEQE